MQEPELYRNPEFEYAFASLRSHEMHMRHIYGLRWAGMAVAALTIVIGAFMAFRGLEGSFNWAVEVPHTLEAKLTNASPGIIFATVGFMLGFAVVLQKPVNYSTGGGSMFEKINAGGVSLTAAEIQNVQKKRSRKHAGGNLTLGG